MRQITSLARLVNIVLLLALAGSSVWPILAARAQSGDSLNDWLTYTNEKCSFSIRYPPGSSLKDTGPTVRIDLPFEPDTNLEEKYIEITCSSDSASRDLPVPSVETSTTTINGVDFEMQSGGDAGAGNFYEVIKYSTQKDVLYINLSFVWHSVDAYNYHPPKLEFDKNLEKRGVDQVMSSFQFSAPAAQNVPRIAWNTFLGGGPNEGSRATVLDEGADIAIDNNGNIYVVGTNNASWGQPINPFEGDSYTLNVSIAKIDNSGTLIWNTFLNAFPVIDSSNLCIAVDKYGDIYIAGSSHSEWGNSPINAYTIVDDVYVKDDYTNNIFIAKLDGDSSQLIWNTFFIVPDDEVNDLSSLKVDDQGNIYFTGKSIFRKGASSNVSLIHWDLYIAKLDTNGQLIWDTSWETTGNVYDMAIDEIGNIYITGESGTQGTPDWGPPLSTHTGDRSDAFVAKINSNGELIWHTYLGAQDEDTGENIEVDASGNIYISGKVGSFRFAQANDMFVIKLNTNGAPIWNIHLFPEIDWGDDHLGHQNSMAIDNEGNIYIVGQIRSSYKNSKLFVKNLETNSGFLRWTTFLDEHGASFDAMRIAIDKNSDIVIMGHSSETWGTPVRPYTSGTDVFVAKLKPVTADQLTILYTSDLYGHLQPESDNQGQTLGGLANIAEMVNQIRKDNPEALLLDAGDTWQGTPLSNNEGGALMVRAMNQMGYTAWMPGNHDFDQGQENWLQRRNEMQFAALGANVFENGQPTALLSEYVIKTVGEKKITILGLANPTTPEMTKRLAVAGLEFRNPIEVAAKLVPKLRQEADLVVVLSHLGLEGDRALADKVPGIDIIIGGHTHHQASDPAEVVNGTVLLAAGQYGEFLGQAILSFDADGKPIIKNKLLPVTSDQAADPAIQKLIADGWQKIAGAQNSVVGTLQLPGNLPWISENLDEEFPLGNLVADAMLAAPPPPGIQPELAIFLNNSLRQPIPSGSVKLHDIGMALPFSNQLVYVQMSGAQIRSILAQASRQTYSVAGIRYIYDPALPVEARIQQILVGCRALRDDQRYWVATIDFLAQGGDTWLPIVQNMAKEQIVPHPQTDLVSAVAGYFRTNGALSPSIDGRVSNHPTFPMVGFTGRVVADIGYDLADVPVRLMDQSGKCWVETVTNEDGVYTMKAFLPEQVYQLEVRLEDGMGKKKVIYGEQSDAISVSRTFTITQSSAGEPYLGNFNFAFPDSLQSPLPPGEANRLDDLALMYYHVSEVDRFIKYGLGYFEYIPPDYIWGWATIRQQNGTIISPTSYRRNYILISAEDSPSSNPNQPENREWHESFHHLMSQVIPGPINALYDMEDRGESYNTHAGVQNPTTLGSWVEGWASFWPCVIRDSSQYASRALNINLEINYKAWDRRGEYAAEDFAVASVLWDLYDPRSAADQDNIDLSGVALFNLFKERGDYDHLPLLTFHDVYIFLVGRAEHGDMRNADGSRVTRKDLEQVFIAHGFFADREWNRVTSGYRYWNSGEDIGWGGRPGRPNVAPVPNAYYEFSVAGQPSGPVQNGVAVVQVITENPYYNYTFTRTVTTLPMRLYLEPPPTNTLALVNVTFSIQGQPSGSQVFSNQAYWETVSMSPQDSFQTAELPAKATESAITGLRIDRHQTVIAGEPAGLAAQTASGGLVSYYWDFGDGQTGEGGILQHIYEQAGVYTATVTAKNSLGSLNALTCIEVVDPPQGRFSLSRLIGEWGWWLLGGGLGFLALTALVLIAVRRKPKPAKPAKKQAPRKTPPPEPAPSAPVLPRPPQASPPPAVSPPPEMLTALRQQGIQQIKAGDHASGMAALQQVLQHSPDDGEAWLWLGFAAAQKKDWRTAERCMLRAEKIGHPQASQALEWMKKHRGR